MAGNKHDNGVHEVGTDEIRNAYQEDTPGQAVEKYIEDRNKAYHEEAKEKKKKHFSQVFDNPLKGFPYNEEFEVSLKEESVAGVEEAKELELSLPMRGFMQDTRKELFGWAKKAGLNPKKVGSGSAEKLEIKGTPKQINKLISYIPVKDVKEESTEIEENADASIKKKAEKTGIPFGILKKVYNRGVAAWKTGHRPGTTPEQWGHARVNSFATKSKGTWGGADKDLAKQVG